MSKKIRWGLISTANINNALIGPINAAGRSELVGIASRDQAKAEAYAKEKGIPHAYGSYEAMLADPNIDAVYISLPNSLHCEWAVAAAKAGKHVLCEKPLVVSMDEFDRVEAAATANSVTVFEAFMYLHHPQTLTAQKLIADGRLGQVQLVQAWFNFYLSPERATNIRLRPDVTGGCLWDVGVYPNSLAVVMAHPAQPRSIFSSQIVGETGVDVAIRGQFVFDGGTVGQVSSSFRTPFREGAYVVGDEAILHIPEPWKPGLKGVDSVMTITNQDGSTERIVTPAVDPYLCEVEAMERCILDGADPVVSLKRSRLFLECVLAQYESARTGQAVAIG